LETRADFSGASAERIARGGFPRRTSPASSYQNDVFNQLKAIARVLPFEQLHFSSFPPETPEDLAVMKHWVADAAKSGARISVITADGRVIADSQSETQTMESHADRPEVLEALRSGEGRSTRTSVSVKQPLLYYAERYNLSGGVPVVVRLALPLEAVDETLGNFRRNLWLWSLVILILAGAISLLVSRSFTERVERLREFSRRVAEGDFRPLAADGTGDTLEALGTH